MRKSLGQHFLSDRRVLDRIVEALAPAPDETVLEIGAGRGALTDLLRSRTRRVIAIEYDRALAARLRQRYAGDDGVEVIEADVLTLDLAATAGGAYVLVGNLPYYITTPILFHALRRPRPERAVYLIQREVADRLAAKPGGKEFGALSVNVQAVAKVESLFRVAPGAFTPPPSVDSAVVRMTPRAKPDVSADEEASFRTFVQAVFGLRRKQIRRVIRELHPMSVDQANTVLSTLAIPPDARPEMLPPERFAALFRVLRTLG